MRTSSITRLRGIPILSGVLALVVSVPCGAQQPPPPHKYALLIGLNRYAYPAVGIATLDYAKADVTALKKVLEQQGYEVTALWDEMAIREGVVRELSRHATIVAEADDFLLYYAGHGVRNKAINRKTYWLTYDAKLEALDIAGIRLPHLLDYVADIRARRKLILLDHCFSGDVIPSATAADPSRGPGEGDVRAEGRGAFPVADVAKSINSAGEGVIMVAAARGAAYELKNYGHGLFTYALLKALNSREADRDDDAKLSVDELLAYLKTKVHDLSTATAGGAQETKEWTTAADTASWFVTERLPIVKPAEAARKASAYQRALSEWEQKQWIKVDTKSRSYEVIQNWVQALQSSRRLNEGDQELLDKIREAVDASAPEKIRAENLEQYVRGLLDGVPR